MVHRALCLAKKTLLDRGVAHWSDRQAANITFHRAAHPVRATAGQSMNRRNTGVFNSAKMDDQWKKAAFADQGTHSNFQYNNITSGHVIYDLLFIL